MAVSWSTATTANSGSSQAASQAIVIPAGVTTGHECLFVACVVPLVTTVPVMSASSTGTAPVQVGPTQTQSVPAPGTVNVSVWKVAAGAADPGATVTFSSTQTGFWAVAMSVWFDTGTGPVIDVSGGTISAAGATSVTCPSLTTGASGDWGIYLTGGTYETGGPNGPAGTTQRASVISSSAVAAAIYDSAASVGGAGTGIGGGTFTTGATNVNNALAAFTIGLAPAGSPPPATSGLLLTAFP